MENIKYDNLSYENKFSLIAVLIALNRYSDTKSVDIINFYNFSHQFWNILIAHEKNDVYYT